MIRLSNVSDLPKLGYHRYEVFAHASIFIPSGRYVLLTANPLIRRPVLDVLAGLRPPNSGRLDHSGTGSWPIGRLSFVRGRLTGYQLIDFVSRLYDLDAATCHAVVVQLMTTPDLLKDFLDHWPNVARQELGHCLAILPQFDVYWVENGLQLPPGRFRSLWHPLFARRLAGRNMILSTTVESLATRFCDKALIIDGGRVEIDDQLERALKRFPIRPRGSDDEPVADEWPPGFAAGADDVI